MAKSLDDQVHDIEKLDQLRKRARTLQEEAVEALTAKIYVPRPRGRAIDAAYETAAERDNWALPGDDIEKAHMLCALSELKPKGAGSRSRLDQSKTYLIENLRAITYQDLEAVPPSALDFVPAFRSARVLHSLAQTPGEVLSNASLVCFYRIVQELNEITAPTWSAGAVRAGDQAIATAFVTGECARALLALEHALLQTAKAAEVLAREAARRPTGFRSWDQQEAKFRKASLAISLSTLEPQLIVPLARAGRTPVQLLGDIKDALTAVPVIGDLNVPQGSVPAPGAGDGMRQIVPLHFARTAKDIAWTAVDRLLAAIRQPIVGTSPEALGASIRKQLKDAAQIVRDLLEPIEPFAESCIDRQLAAASPGLGVGVDGAELVFAATLLGLVTDWNRPKVKAALALAKPMLSVNGRLPSIRPFDVQQEKGYRLNVQTLEVTRRLADLVAKLDVEVEPDFVERLLLPFDYTRVPAVTKSESGWTTDPPARKSDSLWWLTAIAVDALESIIRMLNDVINREVLRNFQVRKPTSLKLGLDELFYPDFGLAASLDRASIAEKLQKLRAHAGTGPAEDQPLFSLILYGPPGTGKTTLVEAVAKSAEVPLVEVTPSDILVGGAEGVERRTRNVFQALSKLTNAVILFDEFDSILLDRNTRDPDEIPTSVIEFLTPGMLPKLKALNDASKAQRVSFLLATNFVDRLDAAVTRGGRFDDKHGIFPPDLISRFGRLVDQLDKTEPQLPGLETQLDAQARAETDPDERADLERQLQMLRRRGEPSVRIRQILQGLLATASGPMDRLGRPGWYTMPRDKSNFTDTLFGALLMDRPWPEVKPEASYEAAVENYKRRVAKKERINDFNDVRLPDEDYWTQWGLIDSWEARFEPQITAWSGAWATLTWGEVYGFMDGL